jgi:hypothetical protein
MDDPLGALRTSEVGILLALALALTCLWTRFVPRLKPPSAWGIVDLEVAFASGRARKIVEDWTHRGLLASAKRGVNLDWPFVVLYSAALAFAGVIAARAAGGAELLSGGHADTLAAVLAYAAWTAGVLDWIENCGLLAMLRGRLAQPAPALTGAVSALKWAIIAATAAAILAWLAAAAIAALA